jgi:aminoglycoside phosphotransferase family enzyme/predicted kinase
MAVAESVEQWIRALSEPGVLPAEAFAKGAGAKRRGSVEVVQTHASIVLLGDHLAWKVKKAVDLGFLDFTRLEDRRHFCEEECRLNRRTAPEVYLGVDAVVRTPAGPLRILSAPPAEEGEVVDYAVRMRRLPADGMLDRRLLRGDLSPQELAAFAASIAAFHATCPSGAGIDDHGGPAGMRRQFLENLQHLAKFAGDAPEHTLSATLLAGLRTAALAHLDRLEPALAARVRGGRVREGHGDLHAGNVCTLEGRLVAYDAIEFSTPIRCRDVACEIAFLGMDLDGRGRPDLAAWWTRAYAHAAGDPGVVPLQPLFRGHYAIVRGLVESIRAGRGEVGDSERARSRRLAQRYLAAALGYLLEPALVLVCGLPGSGKSTMARALATPLRATILRSDAIRKAMAGVPATVRPSRTEAMRLYSAAMTERTYAAILHRAEAALRRGRSAIVDATLATAAQRAPLLALAARSGRPWMLVETTCTREETLRRLERRRHDPSEISDADAAVYTQAAQRYEAPEEVAPQRRIVVQVQGGADDALPRVLDALALAAAPASA